MAYAIVEAGGKQFRVEPGRFYDINRLAAEEDETVTLDRVLFVSSGDGVHVGQPLVEGATVSGTIMYHLRGPKLVVYKMRPKKKTRKKQGHRQELTRLMIDSISVNGSVISADDTEDDTETEQATTADAAAPEAVETETVETETVETEAPATPAAEDVDTAEGTATPTEEVEAESDLFVEETSDEATDDAADEDK